MSAITHAGYIAVCGRPNVGKSTLINTLVGAKISIVSSKPQTTRHRQLGVRTEGAAQFVFVDTPGFQTRHRNALNQSMNRVVTQVLSEVDVVLFLVESLKFTPADERVIKLLPAATPVILVVNKVDQLADKTRLLPFLQAAAAGFPFAEVVPISALDAKDGDRLLGIVGKYLPESAPFFEEDALTDRSERFLAAEIVREKIFRLTGDEIPYGIAVEIQQYETEASGLRRIHAVIWVDREAHKPILLGKGGEHLKRISTEARIDMERLFDAKVFLQCWIKIKSGWADNAALLKSLGHE
ncbi:MAG: GTPase Era [Pseudomonadota bacterium]